MVEAVSSGGGTPETTPPSPPKPQHHSSFLGGLWDDVKSAPGKVVSVAGDGLHALGHGANDLAQKDISASTGLVRDLAGNGAADAFHGVAEGTVDSIRQQVGFDAGLGEGALGALGGMVKGTVGLAKDGYKFATDNQFRSQVVHGAEHLGSDIAHHPLGTAEKIGSGLANAGEAWLRGAGQAAQEGNLGEYLGRGVGSAVVNVGGFFVPGADAADAANLAGHLGEGAEALNDLEKGGEALGDAAKLDHGGQAADGATIDRGANAAGAITRETAHAGQNEATWTLDAQGRPTHVDATLRETNPGAARSSAETNAQSRVTDRPGAKADDDAGHIIGHRFMLDQGERNMFPQNFNFNRSAYKTMENEWAGWTKAGGEVKVHVDLLGGTADRPAEVSVRYEVLDPKSGKAVYKNQVDFDNQAGQSFDRVPTKDMAKVLH